ncbi:MAG: T9SS type A sorting domain-containing protein [Flavobacteriales bacterium]|nr:T9SS type A sorting domain-containing protein [Flavobacteriales bacterium]
MDILKIALLTVFTALSLSISTTTFAQKNMQCAINEKMEQLKEDDPAKYKEVMKANAKQKAEVREIMKSNITKAATTYVVPIVFHIIHDGNLGLLSEDKIIQAVEWLNEDYGGTSPYKDNVDPLFESLYADIGFEFRLAQIDPSGDCSNGINYYNNAQYSYGETSPIPVTWVQNQWPVKWGEDDYVNIYLQRSLGYGYATSSYVVLDVVHLNGAGVGSEGSDNRSWIMHELGHFFNLDHTWGGNNDAGKNGNCSLDDGIEDTPRCKGTYSCNKNLNSCDDGAGDLKDMVHNIMDYSSCAFMFTEGQKEMLVASMLSNKHKNLFTQENLEKAGVQDPFVYGSSPCEPDLTMDIPNDGKKFCQGISINFSYISTGGNLDSILWTFPLSADPATSKDDSPVVSFSDVGKSMVYLTIYAGDFAVLDSVEINVIELGDGAPYPYTMDFENESEFDADYLIVNEDDDNAKWKHVSNAGYSGTSSLRMVNFEKAGFTDEVLSPLMDLSGLTDTTVFSFKLAFSDVNTGKDKLEVMFTKTCGDKWNKFYSKSGSQLTTNSVGVLPRSMDDWRQENIALPIGYNVAGVQFKFVFTSDGATSLYIDDINTIITGLNNNKAIDRSFRIFPNPITSSSVIEFDLPNQEDVSVEVYDVLGRKTSEKSYGNLNKGSHRLELAKGSITKSGIYIIKVRFNNEVVVRKVIRD